jgi:uncharacterized membrane protein YsdA (DUF1294 family)
VLVLGGVALGVTVLLTVALWAWLSGRWAWPPWAAAWLASVTVTAFAAYGADKGQAVRGGWRVPERVLHALTLLGGGLGSYAAMRLFRHKTVKGEFRIIFWLIVIAQVALMAGLAYRLWVE